MADAADRPFWRTVQIRAEDLSEGDVTRNRYGKWDVVTAVHVDEDDLRYVRIQYEVGATDTLRAVDLRPVQMVRPS